MLAGYILSRVFPIIVISFMAVCFGWLYYHILSVANTRDIESRKPFVFIVTICSMVRANDWLYYGPKVILVYLHIAISHYQTYPKAIKIKMLVKYILLSVFFRLEPTLSIIFQAIYQTICSPISLSMSVRIFILHLIIIKPEIWIISHRLALCHETVMWCMYCYVLMMTILMIHIIHT